MRLSRKMGVHKSGFVVPPVPTSWVWNTTYTANATFTAPENGWYRLHVIGRGGNGGAGGTNSDWNQPAMGSCGGGGGAGYYNAVSVFLFAGEQVSISYSSSTGISTITYSNKTQAGSLSSNAGQNGGNGVAIGAGGSGGAGDPTGAPGDASGYDPETSFSGGDGASGNGVYRGTGGGGASFPEAPPLPQGGNATGSTTGSGTGLGSGGGGGIGGDYSYSGTQGGTGYTGGVVIERGA